MNYRTRLKQLVIASFVTWIMAALLVGFLTYGKFHILMWGLMIASLLLAATTNLIALNHSQIQVSEVNKNHSRTKRQVQEQQLKIDRFEYDAKKASELRRIVLNSTQEKDHSVRNMALALDRSMDEILEMLSQENSPKHVEDIVRTRAEGMKRYAADLQSLAKLELKSELPTYEELDFLSEIHRLIDGWSSFGKSRKVRIKLENKEDQMPLFSDINWIDNILTRVVQALIRMNRNSVLHLHMIGYMDAELGDALRIELSIAGREIDDDQLKHMMTEYVSMVEDDEEVGPGLAFVVARRMVQLLNGYLEIHNGIEGLEVLVVLPRNPAFAEELEEKMLV